MEILCFFAGVALVYLKSGYPVLFISIAFLLRAPWRIIYWFFLGFLVSITHYWLIADKGMPAIKVIEQASLVGKVISIPTITESKIQFQFRLQQLNHNPVKATILLSCFNQCPAFKSGQIWQLRAKLKQPENLGNPGHFHFRERLLAEHIHWVGYLKSDQQQLLREDNVNRVLAFREYLASKLAILLPESPSLGIIEALTLGLTNHIDKAQWDLFRHTGTAHLMVISGAHIYLVATLFYNLIYWLWRQVSYLSLYRPAMQSASLGGLIMAFSYALLSGLGIPAQRAITACAVLMLRYFSKRYYSSWQAWRYALFIILIIEPHAVLLPGFYLSFIAVAILITSSQRISYRGFKQIVALQGACLIGLLPFTLFWFSYGSINGLLANLIAIPVVGYLIVPLSLLSLIISLWIPKLWVLWPVDSLIKGLLIFLQWIDKLTFLNLNFALLNFPTLLALIIAIAIIFLLPLDKLRIGAGILLCAGLLPKYPKVNFNQAQLDVLDVGQGLAIVVSTAKHVLLYDTGMKFYKGSDMAQMAIIPYLNTRGIKKIDKIIISHPDLDHRGGLSSLEEKYGQVDLLVDNPKFYQRGQNCHNYPAWRWDGIDFRFLPVHLNTQSKNNSSCVLKITTPMGSVLLTGDIETAAEDYLIEHFIKQLPSDVLVVAHHGSKTSSSPKFIQLVAPKFALISAGFDNRYHFPHQQTLATLAQYKSTILNTIDYGMISIKFTLKEQSLTPQCYKQNYRLK
ncbi:DNA uptake/competence protein ComA [Legionella busanensis]|uniref:DNA uptake/competence protein ComA n=1 Tax=Legionella busanensis TaxID=190655 RepID=A0A378JKR2_9GAMM|nr:DNA internalization-related competence protein ComEC/Rec2 [Legionella busanensis]STX50903.1 DNA uptake/competence protein ComA [Legionella busanensis]